MQAFIYGNQSFAKLISEIAKESGYFIRGFFDDGSSDPDLSFSRHKKEIIEKQIPVFLGIGYSNLGARFTLLDRLLKDGVNLPNLIHPKAHVASSVKLGKGNILMASSFIDAFSILENGNVLWPQALVNHDSVIDSNCFFSPKAMVCGFVKVGSSTFLGAGCVVADKREVPANSFIKANALFA